MTDWRSYHVSVTFHVPLPFAYEWCTDFTPEDGKITGEDESIHLQRRIIERTPERCVMENLYDTGKGWGWERHQVTLRPPNRWHSEGQGNSHETQLDYELTAISARETRLDMHWKSRPVAPADGNRAPPELIEAHVTRLWTLRAETMERDYTNSLSSSKA